MSKNTDKQEKAKKNKKETDLVTKESLCAVCALFSIIALLILFTRSLIFGAIGVAIHSFLIGVFGYFAYPVLLGVLYASTTSLIGKRFVKNRKGFSCVLFTLISIAFIVHTATTYSWELDGYIKHCYVAGASFPYATVTGWLGGLLVYVVAKMTTKVGAIIIFSILTLFFGYLTYIVFKKRNSVARAEEVASQQPTAENVTSAQQPYVMQEAAYGEQTNGWQRRVEAAQPVEQYGYQPNRAPINSPIMQAPQPTVAAQPFAQTGSYVAYGDMATQRPGVTLADDGGQAPQNQGNVGNANVGQAFSPFGNPQNMRVEEAPKINAYENSRAFLFGSTPAENYQRNLIFDPNAQVNKRNSVDVNGNPAMSAPTIADNGYTPSYTAAYEKSVNENTQANRPVTSYPEYAEERRTENDLYAIKEEGFTTPVAPVAPVDSVVSEQPVRSVQQEENYNHSTLSQPQTDSYARVETDRDANSRHEYMDLFSPSNSNIFGNDESSRRLAEETFGTGSDIDVTDNSRDIGREAFNDRLEDSYGERRNLFEDETEEDAYTLRSGFETESRRDSAFEITERNVEVEQPRARFEEETVDLTPDRGRSFVEEEPPKAESVSVAPASPAPTPAPAPAPQPAPEPPKPRVIRPYVRVPLDDFDCRDVEPTSNLVEVEETKANIIATLEDFKITGASIASVTFGPTVTRYNVAIPRTIPPRKVVALDQSIAISLHSSGVNIYPNYEDGVVSIEVPNKDRQFVQLGCMLTGDTFVNAKSSSLMFTMGKDVGNRKVYGDISKMIHLLVAGSSGSGKSVFLGSLIISLIYKYSPEELRLILIDPKKTEFVLYNDLPHLMINEIITDVNKAVQSLNWAIGEMNRRYGLFEQMSRAGTYVVNLDQYNAQLEKNERLPKIVIIIDELADLMLAAKKDIEDRIQNLTQKARAAGIHLIVATQRPSTDVITGVIKSNLPTRIAFAVATDVDSRVILDQTGAQKLLGKGDFLYTMQGINTPVRVQSAFISSEDSQRVVNFIKANNEAYYDENATAYINNTRSGGDGGDSFGGNEEVEAVYIEALRFVIVTGSASISMIQRKCSVGYNKAGKIVEWMEDMGYISSFDGAKARKVLITKEEFESKYGTL